MPSTGIDPIHGNCEIFRESVVCSRPAIAKLCPSRNSMVVVAVRRVSAGIVVPEMLTALVKSSALTSGLIDRLITPLVRTVGRNLNSTPKSLNSIVGVAMPIPEVTAMGTGICPPAWKLAVSPRERNKIRRRECPHQTFGFQCGDEAVDLHAVIDDFGENGTERRPYARAHQRSRSLENAAAKGSASARGQATPR